MSELRIRVRIEHAGNTWEFQHQMSQLDLDQIIPLKAPFSPMEAVEQMQREDQRRRIVDAISASIAHALTDALLDGTKKR